MKYQKIYLSGIVKNFPNIFLSLGSNIGDKKLNITNALSELSEYVIIKKVSSLYESDPLLFENQDKFYNLVIEIEYEETALDLLNIIKNIEIKLGRQTTFRYGPRIIDIDILFFNNQVIQEENLTIPHYDWHNRKFVVEPLSELINQKILNDETNILNQNIKNIGNIIY
jgi:2-amino-4-hydroxy-6-hydroxymethyldihydropteridine diphosphokinase